MPFIKAHHSSTGGEQQKKYVITEGQLKKNVMIAKLWGYAQNVKAM